MVKNTLIIPAYNEEKRILGTLDKYVGLKEIDEIIVICDGTDSTAKIIHKKYKKKVTVFEYNHRLGKGGAVTEGLKKATGEIVGFIDSDGSLAVSQYLKLLAVLKSSEKNFAVIGSRYGGGLDARMPLLRRIPSRIFNFYVNLLFGLGINDTQCGAKIFRREAIQRVLPKLGLTGWAFDIDLIYRLENTGYKVLEVPIIWKHEEGSKIDDTWIKIIMTSIRMFLSTTRLYLIEKTPLKEYQIPRALMSLIYNALNGHFEKRGKTILFLNFKDIYHPQAGGSEEYVFQIGKRLVKSGYRVMVYCPRYEGAKRSENYDGIEIYRVGTQMLTYPFFPFWYYFVLKQKCDVIIDVENGIPFFSRLFVFNRKIILLVHHYHGEVLLSELKFPLNWLTYYFERYIMPIVYGNYQTIAVSPSTKKELVSIGFTPDKIEIIYNGVEQHPEIKYKKHSAPTVCYVGRLKAYKGIDKLIGIFAKIRKKIPNARLIIAGRGETTEYEKQIRRLGIETAVSIIQNPSEEKKWEIFGRSRVFATCSRKEGWGITVIEANSVGTPAIGYNVSGLKDSVVPKLNGELADTEKEFENLLVKYLLEPNKNKAITKYSKKFTWDKTTEGVGNFLGVFYGQ